MVEIIFWTGIGLAAGLGILGGLVLCHFSLRATREEREDMRRRFLESRRK